MKKHIIKFLVLVGFGYLWRKMGSKVAKKLTKRYDEVA